MFFRQIPVGPMQNFSYVIGDQKSKEAAIVDPGWETNKLIESCSKEKLEVKKIILTHSHFDHTQKADELASKTGSDIYLHEDDYNEVKRAIKNPNIRIHKLKDNDEIGIGSIKIKVLHTPGHCPGAICLLLGKKLLTGDTLFVSAIGRIDLPGADATKMFESLQKIKNLDDDIEFYPGHDYGELPYSTIGSEKKSNPYLACRTKQDFFKFLGLF